MAQLDGGDGAVAKRELRNTGMTRYLAVRPQTGAAMGDAAAFLHSGGFREDDSGATDGEATEMHHMPIVKMSVMR